MTARLSLLLSLAALLVSPGFAKDKKAVLPDYVLRARTVSVVIDPDAGEPLNQPMANSNARENVEKALSEWGRFTLVMDGQESDLVISVRTGDGRAMRPTMKGGPLDQRPGIAQGTDSSIRIGGQRGQPTSNDPTAQTPDRRPQVGNEAGPSEDMMAVYRGGIGASMDAPPVWRYIAQDCLRSPTVAAVEQFRKAIVEAEKAKPPKSP
jgi:hypothetical protein